MAIFLWIILQIGVGILYANMAEWLIHKYILHGLGKNKQSKWSFHFHNHHRNARKNNFYDETYVNEPFGVPRQREKYGLVFLNLLHLWLAYWVPFFLITTISYSAFYLWAHKKAHVDTDWGKKWFPHHYDHHMGKDQDANWGVVLDWCDKIMGTRKKGLNPVSDKNNLIYNLYIKFIL